MESTEVFTLLLVLDERNLATIPVGVFYSIREMEEGLKEASKNESYGQMLACSYCACGKCHIFGRGWEESELNEIDVPGKGVISPNPFLKAWEVKDLFSGTVLNRFLATKTVVCWRES